MLESIKVTERLHWPEVEMSKKYILSNTEKPASLSQGHLEKLSPNVLQDLFTTVNRSYNVLLQMEQKERQSPKHSPRRRPTASLKCASMFHRRHCPLLAAPAARQVVLNTAQSKSLSNLPKAAQHIAVLGSAVRLSPRPVTRPTKTCKPNSPWIKLPLLYRPSQKIENAKKLCILSAIKPSNVEKEKFKFLKSGFSYNPQFEYSNPVSPLVLERHSSASNRFLTQAVRIMEVALEKYSTYEKFELATGGNLLPKSRIWYNVRKYMEKEGCVGEIVVNVTDDLLSRASMMVVKGRPTLTINTSSAREHWLEGMLHHEIGTHYFRGINNSHQPWSSSAGRKRHSLKPLNPTEEGLASIHSVLFRKDPTLWRAALLYYTVYQASHMSFTQLFHSLGRFVHDPNTRWDYCVRAKRGQTDTGQPGCFSKDQVYLDGILKILRHRDKIDFPMLVALGKVSFEDVDRLKGLAQMEKVRIPHFLQDRAAYAQQLDKIMEANRLTDAELGVIV